MQLDNGWIADVRCVTSPHCDDRPATGVLTLLVVHNISLPPGRFGGFWIDRLFTGTLNPAIDPCFATIWRLQVSVHCFIWRYGGVVQHVPFHRRVWHAGMSCYQGRERCDNFSIGTELKGTDILTYTDAQYRTFVNVTRLLLHHYPITSARITGHSDIAPERKTDPGPSFSWCDFRQLLSTQADDI